MNLFGVNTDFVMGRYTPNYDAPVMILIVKSLGVQNAISAVKFGFEDNF